jgi:hypothetical protein
MIGAIAAKAVGPGTFLNPFRFYKLSTAGAEALTIDSDMGPLTLLKFARGMKAVSAGGNGVTLTVPVSDTNLHTSNGSAVKWDSTKAKALFKALAEDKTSGLKTT